MRKKSSFSEENVLVPSNNKLSEILRQNPRLPKKMKTLKSNKCVNPTVRTVGQLSGAKHLPTIFGSQNVFKVEPVCGDSNPMTHMDSLSWTHLDRSLSQNRSPRRPPGILLDSEDYSMRERSWSKRCDNINPFCVVSDVERQTELLSESELQTESATPTLHTSTPLNRKTSENGVQVNMFHCKECRRHIKYGKNFKNETSCTESDSESNLFLSNCTACERKEGMNSPNNREGDGTENNERGDCSLKCNVSPRDHVHTLCDDNSHDNNTLTPRTEFTSMDGGKKIWLSDIKFITAALLTVSTILYLAQLNCFGATISSINIYLRNLMLQEQIEEKFSVFDWISYILFNAQEYVKPRPLFLYLF